MSRKYKIINGPSFDRLETLVNTFLSTKGNEDFDFVGPPQVFGHELYIQALATPAGITEEQQDD